MSTFLHDMRQPPDNYALQQALQAVCRSHTRVNYAYMEDSKVYATIITELDDPHGMDEHFEKIGYDVIEIHHLGGDTFQFVMTIQGVN